MTAEEVKVSPFPPGGEQSQRSADDNDADSAVDGSDVVRLHDREDRVKDKKSHQAEENVRPHDEPEVHGQRERQRNGQHSLGNDLADAPRYGQARDAAVERCRVEDQQPPGDTNPAEPLAFTHFGWGQRAGGGAGTNGVSGWKI